MESARKGLLCQNATPFVRRQLLGQAVINGGFLGIQLLQFASSPADIDRGLSYLRSALRDVGAFIAEAALDDFWLMCMLNWHVLLTFLVRGSELSDGLGELQVHL